MDLTQDCVRSDFGAQNFSGARKIVFLTILPLEIAIFESKSSNFFPAAEGGRFFSHVIGKIDQKILLKTRFGEVRNLTDFETKGGIPGKYSFFCVNFVNKKMRKF